MAYIRKDYHHLSVNMIPLISDGTVSISSYIDHVLTEHFKQYGTVIDEMYLEKQRTSTSVSAFLGRNKPTSKCKPMENVFIILLVLFNFWTIWFFMREEKERCIPKEGKGGRNKTTDRPL